MPLGIINIKMKQEAVTIWYIMTVVFLPTLVIMKQHVNPPNVEMIPVKDTATKMSPPIVPKLCENV